MSIAQQIMANPGRYSKEQLQSALNQGLVPAYIAIPLIEQKAKEAAAYKTAELAAQAPQQNAPTVAEEVLARASQPIGVPALPTNLPEGYAPGGIVAFDDGGEVPHFDGTDGSYVDEYASMYNAPENTGEYSTPFTPPRGVARFFQNLNPFESEESKARRAREDKRLYVPPPGYDKNGKPVSSAAQISAQAAASAPTPASIATPAKTPAAALSPAGGIDKLPAAPSVPNISTALGRATNLYTPDVIRQLKESRKPIYLDESKYVPKELTVPEAAKQVKDVQAAFGVSEKPYEEQSARLGKREKDLEKRKAESIWDAVIRAGLATAAGTSQYALTNIAKGGLEGLQQYTEAVEKLDASQEKLDAAQFALADAQNRFRQEGSKEAAADLRENRRDVKEAKREVARDRVTADRQAQALAREDTRAQLADAARVQGQNLQLQAQEIGFKLQQAGLNIQQFNAKTQSIIANRPDLVGTTLGFLNQDPEFVNAPGKKKAEIFANALSSSKVSGHSVYAARIEALVNEDLKNAQLSTAFMKLKTEAEKKAYLDRLAKESRARHDTLGVLTGGPTGATSQTDPLGLGF